MLNKLQLFGATELRCGKGKLAHSFLSGKKRLALLIYLVLNHHKGFQRRDHLLALFWPELNQQEARNSLSNMLWHIRKELGKEFLISRGKDELMVDIKLLECDVIQYRELIKEEQYDKAIGLYKGKFLEGFYVSHSSIDLERWIDHEREQLHTAYLASLEALSKHFLKEGQPSYAAELLKKKLVNDPYDTDTVSKLVKVLSDCGRGREGVKYAQEHANLLEREFEEDGNEVKNRLLEGVQNNPSPQPELPGAFDSVGKKELGVAVLPFEEMGADAEISFFSNALHHDILSRLSCNSELKVISRTSVLRYRHPEKSLPEIAAELGASTIVEGGVQMFRDEIRVYVQVIDARKDDHRVAETYDRKLTADNFLEVQSELAEKISDTIITYVNLPIKHSSSVKKPTENKEAYRCYILAKRELDKRTLEGMEKSIDLLDKALELDSGFALAWLGYADTLSLLHDYGYREAEECLPSAEKAIVKALELDPMLSDSHASLGLLYGNGRRFSLGIVSLKKAIELNSSCFEAYNWLSWSHQIIGKPLEALQYAKRAVELNPLYPEAVSNLSSSYLQNGLLEQALLEAKRTFDLEPTWTTSVFYEALVLYEMKRYTEAAELLQKITVPWAGQGPKATIGLCYLGLGKKEEVIRLETSFLDQGHLFASGLMSVALGSVDKGIEKFLMIEKWDYWSSISFYSLYPDMLKPVHNSSAAGILSGNIRSSWGYAE